MKKNDTPLEALDDQNHLIFILPAFATPMGFSCSREWTEEKASYECGCPRCLKKSGLTLIYHQEDWNDSGDMQEHWRKRIVSAKTASYAPHLVCSGYELQ